MSSNQVAEWMNKLGDFCGRRDIEELTQEALYQKYQIRQADVMVLFGGSILCGGDVLAEAIKNKVAKKYMIVGGVGHTTKRLREKIKEVCPTISTEGLSEAELFTKYLADHYGLAPDYLEQKSTNCGNNVTYCLEGLKEAGESFEKMIIVQDATMQRRMEAGFRKYLSEKVTLINYAAYQVEVCLDKGQLRYSKEVKGMWEIEEYQSLLMGEIPRLSDDLEGYGPLGKNFIAHVDIPKQVREAFEGLRGAFQNLVRRADSQYASKESSKESYGK